MSSILFEVLKLIVMLCCTFILVKIVPAVRNKYSQEELEYVRTWAKDAVNWSQQMFWAESGATRKGVVMEFLKRVRDDKKLPLTDEQIEVLVEAAVRQMNELDGIGYIEVEGDEDGDDSAAD